MQQKQCEVEIILLHNMEILCAENGLKTMFLIAAVLVYPLLPLYEFLLIGFIVAHIRHVL